MKFYIFTLFLLFTSLTNSQIKVDEQIVSPGVVYKKITNTVDTLSIDIIRIDLSKGDYVIKSVKANNLLGARQTTTDMAKAFIDSGYYVIAALNADFFEADGEVVNNMISEGQFVKAVKFTDSPYNDYVNTQFAFTYDNKLLIDQFVFSGSIIFPDGTIESISRINSKTDSSSITLYNSYQGKTTPSVVEGWNVSETVLVPFANSGDTLFFSVADDFQSGGNMQIPENGYVLSTNNKYAYYLERNLVTGDTLRILLRLNPHYPDIRSLTGGWPLLVKDGENAFRTNPDIEGVIPRFSQNRHPRTGVGFSKDSTTVYFITVDGRQSHSRGMSLLEFADIMIDQGVYQGLNLDGGGSTAMIVKNKLVNIPSDAEGERKVGNCLLLLKRSNE
ncbi:MAG: phosphodiester glycosidase family protein [Ignavibacterium sp.]|nr:phosphodiester glycosidase family protein [Ignavibacterium sp.]